ncbi:DNA-binding MarR family transcriptional regulator [Amorphus suaedae]
MPDDDDDPLRLDRQVCFPLYAATNLITRLYRPILAALGLTYPQYLVMLVLWEGTPRSVGDLGRALYLDSGTLTPLLKRLEQAGLVTRRRDPADERRVLVDLTEEGRALRARAESVPATMAEGFDVDPEALDRLRETVRALVDTLGSHAALARIAGEPATEGDPER